MTFDPTQTVRNLESLCQTTGLVPVTDVGEPRGPVDVGPGALAAFIMGDDIAPAEMSINGDVHEIWQLTVRIMSGFLAEPPADAEIELMNVTQQIKASLAGDFDLGASVRNVDVGGQFSDGMRTRFGHVRHNNTMYRVAEVSVPFVVNAAYTATP